MAETISTSYKDVQNVEEFKSFFLQLLEEDAFFFQKIKKKLQKKEEAKRKKDIKPLPPPIPISEMPYWKLKPNYKPLDPKDYAISAESLKKVQEAWRDMPSAEELIALLNK